MYGFRAFNRARGSLQIDNEHPLLHLVASGVRPYSSGITTDSIEYDGAPDSRPLLALRPEGATGSVLDITRSGTSHFSFQYLVAPTGPCQVRWYLYDLPPPAPTHGRWGVELYKNGRVIFTDRYPLMRVVTSQAPGARLAMIRQGPDWQNRVEVLYDSLGQQTGQVAASRAIYLYGWDTSGQPIGNSISMEGDPAAGDVAGTYATMAVDVTGI